MARLFQFSIRGLLVAVTILAVGIAALLNANGLWLGFVWGLALYALAASILLIIYRREEKRAFWLGFVTFGGLYLLLFALSQQSWIRIRPLAEGDLLATQLAAAAHERLLPESRRAEYINVPIQQAGGMGMGGMPVGGMAMPGMPGMAGMDMGGDAAMMSGGGMMPGGGMPGGGMPGMEGGMPGAGGPYPLMNAQGTVSAPNPNYVPLQPFTHIFHALCLLLMAAIGGKTCQLIYRTRPAA